MKHLLLSLTIVFALTCPSTLMAQSTAITLDGLFDDWTEDLATRSDAPEVISGVNLLEIQVSNDEFFLFIRIKTDIEFDLLEKLIAHDVRLYLDTDNDENTGDPVQAGFGAELSIVFSERYALYHMDPTVRVKLNSFSLLASPTVSSSEFELAIKRSAVPDGTHPLFTSSTIKILLENGLNDDKLPDEGSDFLYTFDETEVPPMIPTDILKEDTTQIRILAYNTKNDGLNEASRLPHFKNIISVLSPDIIGFSECYNTSHSHVKMLLDTWLPLDNSWGWYIKTGSNGDLITASRWPILSGWDNLPRQFPTLIDLPDYYSKNLLFTNAHLKCCDGDDQRQDQVDAYTAFISDAKSAGGNISLPEGTPFVYGGDLNLVGYAQQLNTLLTGDIQNTSEYGEGAPPDWDDSPVSDVMGLHTDQRLDYTWRNDYSDYIPGKLDFLIYSDAVMMLEKSFALHTEVMPTERLQLYGLNQDATRSASDHFPLVADFSINTTIGITLPPILNHRIYPNPAKAYINITFNKPGSYLIRICDLHGSLVFSDELHSNQSSLRIEDLSSGMYVITIIGKDGSKENHKLFKQ